MTTTRRRRPVPQLTLDDLFAYHEDGAQLDLVEEAGVETIGPSTIAVAAFVPTLFDLEV